MATLGIFVFGQFVEGNILSPKLVGDSVGLHPVWLMFALLAFGVALRFRRAAAGRAARSGPWRRSPALRLRQYLASPLYRGEPIRPSSRREGRYRCVRCPSSSPSICRSIRASGARISSSARRTSRPTARSRAGPTGPTRSCVLIGPRGSGKSHLASIWAATAHAWTSRRVRGRQDKVPHLVSNGALAIEDVDRARAGRGGLVPPAQSGAGEARLRAAHHARRRRTDGACARPIFCPGCALRPSVSLGRAGRCAAQGRAGEALRRPATRGRYQPLWIISRSDRTVARQGRRACDTPRQGSVEPRPARLAGDRGRDSRSLSGYG